MTTDLIRTDATGLAELISTGKASSVEVVQAHLDRIEATNPNINAIVRARCSRCPGQKRSGTRHDSTVELTYFRSPDGAIYAKLGSPWRGFNELLSDAITPLPPIGSDETSLSTYWIDRATRELLQRRETGDDGPVQSGNATTLILSGSTVIATSDYELFDDESMSVDDFLDILNQWRGEVIAVRDSEHPQIPETYRRNPYPS